jgi:hypothetical protein
MVIITIPSRALCHEAPSQAKAIDQHTTPFNIITRMLSYRYQQRIKKRKYLSFAANKLIFITLYYPTKNTHQNSI